MTNFIRCRLDETGGEQEFPAAVVPVMQARGWEPVSEPRSYSQAEDDETIAAQERLAGTALVELESEMDAELAAEDEVSEPEPSEVAAGDNTKEH